MFAKARMHVLHLRHENEEYEHPKIRGMRRGIIIGDVKIQSVKGERQHRNAFKLFVSGEDPHSAIKAHRSSPKKYSISLGRVERDQLPASSRREAPVPANE